MRLQELEKFNPITIQCHDNPDADTIACGYALYSYFADKGHDVKLIYSGKNQVQKCNLILMLEKLDIPLVYISPEETTTYLNGLLIMVDCQYGAGNVTKFPAEHVAVIDHHQVEMESPEMSIIRPELGSCSTLVWKLLLAAGYELEPKGKVATALYYGLFTDTNQMAELNHPLDRDARDFIAYEPTNITLFRNSNISMQELRIAGEAMLKYQYNQEMSFSVVEVQPCDPNILGLIGDFLLQVDKINNSIVYNENQNGYKLSVRSCVVEVNAAELAGFLTKEIGSGGGHYEKAGGFISKKMMAEKYGNTDIHTYLMERMRLYFQSYELVYADTYEADLSQMKLYEKVKVPLGYVKICDVVDIGTPITIRTMEGDMSLIAENDLYVMIGVKGEVYPIRREKFEQSYSVLDRVYNFEEDVIENDYTPTIQNRMTGQNMLLTKYAGCCVSSGNVKIYIRPLERGVKVFTAWDKSMYMLGQKGDYLAVRSDDVHDIYVIEKNAFAITYQECK